MSLFERMVSLIEEETKNNIIHIQKTIESKHHSSYLIGGSVRDLAMGIKPKDYDITTSMDPEDVKNLFKRVFDTGIKHGAVTVLLGNDKFEITTFRVVPEGSNENVFINIIQDPTIDECE